MPKVELTNMVMIQGKATGKILVHESIKSWKGLSFPGGHVEFGETNEETLICEFEEQISADIKVKESSELLKYSFHGETQRNNIY